MKLIPPTCGRVAKITKIVIIMQLFLHMGVTQDTTSKGLLLTDANLDNFPQQINALSHFYPEISLSTCSTREDVF